MKRKPPSGASFIPPDQAERDLILTALSTNLMVEAAAGSGKTTSMVGRMVALLKAGACEMSTLAAMTFTNKAASEIRGRFHAALVQEAQAASSASERNRLQRAIEDSDRCFIGTIHAFCGRLLRERPLEAKVAVPFDEIDDEEDAALRLEAWDQFVERCYVTDDAVLNRLDAIGLQLGDLREAFVTFADYPDVDDWPCAEVKPPDVKAILKELRPYWQHMQTLAQSFPADRLPKDPLMKLFRQLPRLAATHDLQQPSQVMEHLQNYQKELKWNDLKKKEWEKILGSKEQLEAEMIRWNQLVTEHVLPALQRWRQHRYPVMMSVLKQAREEYDRVRAQKGKLNFQDLLLRTAEMLRQQEPLRRYYRKRYTHLLVDEFQDTDPLQAEVLFLLTADDPKVKEWWRARPVHGSLFLVGDPQQSIYRFRRADIVTYEKAKKLIVQAGGQVVPLTTNFRSRPGLVRWVNRCFAGVFPKESTPYAPMYRSMEPGRVDDADDPEVLRHDLPAAYQGQKLSHQDVLAQFEAQRVADDIQERLSQGASQADDFMILARNKARLNFYAGALAQRHIPYQLTGQNALAMLRELNWLLNVLRALTQPGALIDWVAMLRGPCFGLSDRMLFRFKAAGGRWGELHTIPSELPEEDQQHWGQVFERIRALLQWTRRLPPASAIARIMDELGLTYRQWLLHGERQAIFGLGKALEWLRSERHQLLTWAEWIERLEQLQASDRQLAWQASPDPLAPAVRIMNLHQVKGLEAKVVFLADPSGDREHAPMFHIDRRSQQSRGYLIIRAPRQKHQLGEVLAEPTDWDNARHEAEQFEAREQDRLRYVAATRAKDQLIIAQRSQGQEKNFWSAFAADLEDRPVMQKVERTATESAEGIEVSADEPEQWRAEIRHRWSEIVPATYRIQGVKAFAVSMDKAAEPYGTTADSTPYGLGWGTLLHALLERKMRQPEEPLEVFAKLLAAEEDIEEEHLRNALAMVEKVSQSEIWKAAMTSPKKFSEVPIQQWVASGDVIEGQGKTSFPTLLSGQIDLVFWREDGWVIVDYKSDRINPRNRSELISRYRPQVEWYARLWEQITQESVKEMGIFFLDANRYERVLRQS